MSFKVIASEKIVDSALSGSNGLCSLHVRRAIQEAKNIPAVATGINEAKNYGPWLIRNGYKATKKTHSEASVGDVAIFDSIGTHHIGHIQILTKGNVWVSDFKQRNFYPYADGSKPNYVIYE